MNNHDDFLGVSNRVMKLCLDWAAAFEARIRIYDSSQQGNDTNGKGQAPKFQTEILVSRHTSKPKLVNVLGQPLGDQLCLNLAQKDFPGLFLNSGASQRRRMATLDARRHVLNLHEVASNSSPDVHYDVLD